MRILIERIKKIKKDKNAIVLAHSYQNIEIVLIDDGSTDNSLEICENFAEKDDRIKLISQKNGGLSAARNTGIDNANGKYVVFVDSDDFLEIDAIENLVNQLNADQPQDIILANGIRIQNEIKAKIKKDFAKKTYSSGKDYLISKLVQETYFPAVWLNMYSLEMLRKNGLYFKKGRLHEDVEWFPRVLLQAAFVTETDMIIYNYLIRNDSITTQKNKRKNGLHLIQTVNELMEEVNFKNKKENKIFRGYLSNVYLNAIYIGKLEKSEYNRHFPLKNSYSIEQFAKAILFEISPRWYNYLRKNREDT